MRHSRWSLLVLLSLALFLSGCDGSDGGDVQISGGTGRLEVRLVDAPLDLAQVSSVLVSIDSVTVFGGVLLDGTEIEPTALTTHPTELDLLTLTGGASELLASGELTAGFYDRIRLDISAASLTFLDGTIEPLKIESNKVDVPIRFEIGTNDLLEITLDFQADASVHVTETGSDKYILRPVVTPVSLSDDPEPEPEPPA